MSQSDDSEAIFALAKEIATSSSPISEEIRLRSAVSRAYYAVFLLAREKTRVTGDIDVHAEVVRRVLRKGRIFGDQLHKLKLYRNAADYSFPSAEEYKDWNQNWNFVELKARQLLDRFKTW